MLLFPKASVTSLCFCTSQLCNLKKSSSFYRSHSKISRLHPLALAIPEMGTYRLPLAATFVLVSFTHPCICRRAGGQGQLRGTHHGHREPWSCPGAKTLPTAPPLDLQMDDAIETGSITTKTSPYANRPNPQYPTHIHHVILFTTTMFYDVGVFCFWKRQSTILNKQVFALTLNY